MPLVTNSIFDMLCVTRTFLKINNWNSAKFLILFISLFFFLLCILEKISKTQPKTKILSDLIILIIHCHYEKKATNFKIIVSFIICISSYSLYISETGFNATKQTYINYND